MSFSTGTTLQSPIEFLKGVGPLRAELLKKEFIMEIEAAKLIGAGLAVIGVIGSGIGIGTIFASFIQAVGRNPSAQAAVFPMTMLGFALVEAIALFALVIALVILFG